MFTSTHPILALSAFLSLISFASPIPQTPNLTPNLTLTHPTNLTSISNDKLHCLDLLNPFAPRPKYADCTLAIQQLPIFPALGPFHNQGTEDPFKLPVEKTVGSCTVRIELYAASTTVVASWPGISMRADTLNRACLRMKFPIYKGGWATYAKDERIVISLVYSGGYGGGGGGVTNAKRRW